MKVKWGFVLCYPVVDAEERKKPQLIWLHTSCAVYIFYIQGQKQKTIAATYANRGPNSWEETCGSQAQEGWVRRTHEFVLAESCR